MFTCCCPLQPQTSIIHVKTQVMIPDVAPEPLSSQDSREPIFPNFLPKVAVRLDLTNQMLVDWDKWAFLSPLVLRWFGIKCFMNCKWKSFIKSYLVVSKCPRLALYHLSKIFISAHSIASWVRMTASVVNFLMVFWNENFVWEVDWIISLWILCFLPVRACYIYLHLCHMTLVPPHNERKYFPFALILSMAMWLALVNRTKSLGFLA